MANAISVVAQGQVENNVVAKVEETKEKLKTEHLSFYGELAAERVSDACALMDIICL